MAVAFFEVAEERRPTEMPKPKYFTEMISEHEQRLADQYVIDFFARFDKNKDGTVTKSELPSIVWKHARHDLDVNGDNIVKRSELVQVASFLFHDYEETADD